MKIEKEDVIEIAHTHNGFIVKEWFVEELTKNGKKIHESDITTFQFSNNDEELVKLKELFELIAERFGYTYDKFSENNLNIELNMNKKGHKL